MSLSSLTASGTDSGSCSTEQWTVPQFCANYKLPAPYFTIPTILNEHKHAGDFSRKQLRTILWKLVVSFICVLICWYFVFMWHCCLCLPVPRTVFLYSFVLIVNFEFVVYVQRTHLSWLFCSRRIITSSDANWATFANVELELRVTTHQESTLSFYLVMSEAFIILMFLRFLQSYGFRARAELPSAVLARKTVQFVFFLVKIKIIFSLLRP